MCERCREHDRLNRRKIKALRGIIPIVEFEVVTEGSLILTAPETEQKMTDAPATVAPCTNTNLIPSSVLDNEAIPSSSPAGTQTRNEPSTENNPSQQIFNLMFPNIVDAVSVS
jgi:hypothetical protein